MVPPPPNMVSRTSFSEPRTPLACTSIVIFPSESSSTFSLKSVAIWPTIVSSGLTSAYTRVTSGIFAVSYLPEAAASALVSPSAASVFSSALVSSFAASVAAGAAVVVSGVFRPQPARVPAAIAAQSAVLNHLFFMLHILLLIHHSRF